MPERLTRPTVGLIPTIPLTEEGQTIEPSVSVPMATAHRFAETATPEPELEPQGLRSSAYGFRHWPPRALHPLLERVERKFAHSDRFALPRITAPASRSRPTTNASRGGPRVAERERPRRRLHAVGGVDVVLDQHGDPMERSANLARTPLGVHRARDLERVGVRLQDRMQRRVDGLDPGEVGLGEDSRGEPTRGHGGLQVRDRRFVHVERIDLGHVRTLTQLGYRAARGQGTATMEQGAEKGGDVCRKLRRRDTPTLGTWAGS